MLEFFKKFKIFIICSHDAGGGNVLSSLVQQLRIEDNSFFIIDGPSKYIYEKTFINLRSIEYKKILDFKSEETLIITSTSGDSELERNLIAFGKSNGITTISILDHWSNFKIRFLPLNARTNDDLFLSLIPDYLIVTDVRAQAIAQKLLVPTDKIILIKNPYLEKIKKSYVEISKRIIKHNRVLYMSEYFKSLNNPMLTEVDYLRNILDQISKFIKIDNHRFEFYIRLHPSETSDKYFPLLETYSFVTIGKKEVDLLEDIAASKIVIGKTSMGLIVSSLLGIPTFSFKDPNFDFIELDNDIPIIEKINQDLLSTLL